MVASVLYILYNTPIFYMFHYLLMLKKIKTLLYQQDIKAEISNISNSKDSNMKLKIKAADCVVVFLMSHGQRGRLIVVFLKCNFNKYTVSTLYTFCTNVMQKSKILETLYNHCIGIQIGMANY